MMLFSLVLYFNFFYSIVNDESLVHETRVYANTENCNPGMYDEFNEVLKIWESLVNLAIKGT